MSNNPFKEYSLICKCVLNVIYTWHILYCGIYHVSQRIITIYCYYYYLISICRLIIMFSCLELSCMYTPVNRTGIIIGSLAASKVS